MSPPLLRQLSTRSQRAPIAGLVAFTAALGLWTWLRVEGTVFADAIEYLEQADAIAHGTKVVDAQAIRASGVPLLHVNALWLASAVGVEDLRWVPGYAAVVHLLISCLFVVLVTRLGEGVGRKAGLDPRAARLSGLFGGLVAALSPTFLQFSAIAMTDIPAGAALAFGLERALFARPPDGELPSARSESRRGFQAGLGFGLAVFVAFKTIPLVALGCLGAALASTLERGLRASLPRLATGAAVVATFVLAQCSMDVVTYGSFGSGIGTYVLANFGPTAGTFLWNLGLIDLGRTVYGMGAEALGNDLVNGVSSQASDLASVQKSGYYFRYFEWFAAPWLAPIMVLGVALASVGSFRNAPLPGTERSKREALGRLVAVLTPILLGLAFAAVSSRKGAKEIRLWLPILPIFAVFAGIGLHGLAGRATSLLARPRAALAAAALLTACIHGPTTLGKASLKEMGSLARAAAWLEGAAPSGLDHTPVVSASFHWSVMFRTPPSWELMKLSHQLDRLGLLSAEERAETLAELEELDAIIIHTALLTADGNPDAPEGDWATELFNAVTKHFQVAAAFWDRDADRLRRFGPILVLLRRRENERAGRSLFELNRAPADDASRPPLIRLERTVDDLTERVELSDARVMRLPGDGLYFVEFDVDARCETIIANYVVAVRVADESDVIGFTSFRRPRWGKGRTSQLREGTRWTEGFVLAPDQGPMDDWSWPSAVRDSPEIVLCWDLVTVDAGDDGGLFVTGRLQATGPAPRRAVGGIGLLRIGTFPIESEPSITENRLRLESTLSGQ